MPLRFATIIGLSTLLATSAHAGWKLVDLGPQAAAGVNALGEIVGNDGNAGRFDAAGFHAFSFLPGSAASAALAVNDAGVAVGFDLAPQPDDSTRAGAVAWTAGVPTRLPVLAPGYCCSKATGINASGTIAGTAFGGEFGVAPTSSMAFVDAGGVLTPLGTLNGGKLSEANAINAAGDVVGESGNDAPGCPDCVAFVWRGGVLSALGLLPGTSASFAHDINGSGVVVGDATSIATGYPLAFTTKNGRIKALPLPPGAQTSTATALNDAGQIVGTAAAVVNGSLRGQSAFLYQGGKYTDLSTLAAVKAAGFTELVPARINAGGTIVGTGKVDKLFPHAFALVPTAN